MRTSHTHPLRIDELRLDGIPGAIGLTFCPGKVQPGALTGAWARDLAADLEVVRAWRASAIVNLLEPHELDELRVSHLESAARSVCGDGLTYVHAPIRDVSIPDAAFEKAWAERHGRVLRGLLRSGRNVLVFCKGGLGRTGKIAARLAVELGCSPHDAIERVRAAREGADHHPRKAVPEEVPACVSQSIPDSNIRGPAARARRRTIAAKSGSPCRTGPASFYP